MATFIKKRTVAARAVVATVLLAVALTGCKKQTEPEEPAAVPAAQTPITTAAPAGTPAAEPGELRILYVGKPRSGREKDFVRFLGKHFATVETGDLKTFDGSQCDGFDVTIVDYDDGGDGFKAPRPRIPDQFSRPLVTVGVPGGLMCSQWRLKTGYL
ncbi:MAG: hypothetical protein JW741_27870 [Sedimentisphaerales bacterium]|nr:hypothetical protein [Sedimentisphaerales bacterium]